MDEFQETVLPKHLGIIMDGNGRWAAQRNQPRTAGHYEGLKTAKRIIKAASIRSIPFVTLYAFSTENWRRSEQEVSYLMQLIAKHLKRELPFYKEYNLKICHSGDFSTLSATVQRAIKEITDLTSSHTGTSVALAINYGGRDEIIRAFRRCAAAHPATSLKALTEEDLRSKLDNADIPDPDLIVRTGGEKRLSNFLLWQSAYSELFFSDKLWPDWKVSDLDSALAEFSQRKRRFGGEK